MKVSFLPNGLSYGEVLDLQLKEFNTRVERRKENLPLPEDLVLFVEHAPVYTLGLHGKDANLLLDSESLREKNIEYFKINRGGDITYHGPGQLTVYPIIDLQRYNIGVKEYVDTLEGIVIDAIAAFGIKGERIEGRTGVWVGKGSPRERKISAIGIKCSRHVTMHGFALNVGPDLSNFLGIVPCGLSQGVTSVSAEVGKAISVDDVKFTVWEILYNKFSEKLSSAASQEADSY